MSRVRVRFRIVACGSKLCRNAAGVIEYVKHSPPTYIMHYRMKTWNDIPVTLYTTGGPNVKGQEKLNRHVIFEREFMLFAKNYQNQSVLVENTACRIWHVFETLCSSAAGDAILTFYLSLNSNHWTLDVITFQDPFFKIFANQHPVFIISFHLPEIPPLPLG